MTTEYDIAKSQERHNLTACTVSLGKSPIMLVICPRLRRQAECLHGGRTPGNHCPWKKGLQLQTAYGRPRRVSRSPIGYMPSLQAAAQSTWLRLNFTSACLDRNLAVQLSRHSLSSSSLLSPLPPTCSCTISSSWKTTIVPHQQSTIMSASAPTILFVHGAWHSPVHFGPIRKKLESDGYPTVCPQQPSFNAQPANVKMYADAECIRNELTRLIAHPLHMCVRPAAKRQLGRCVWGCAAAIHQGRSECGR